jgi:hypothetical protein
MNPSTSFPLQLENVSSSSNASDFIQKVPGSNLSQDTDHPKRFSMLFLSNSKQIAVQ